MQKSYYFFPTIALTLFLAASVQIASAHERRVYRVGANDYTFVVGFVNEPVNIDDKSGVDLAVSLGSGAPTMGPDGDMDGPPRATTPVTGLEKTLKVEIGAGNEKKVLGLAPVRGAPGHYSAVFYPSIETTYTFRVFGTIGTTPVAVSFPCNASDQAPTTDSTMKKISEGLMQKSASGAFGCPVSRIERTFPTPPVTLSELDQKVRALEGAVGSDLKGVAGMILGALGLAVGIGAWQKSKKR